MISDYHLRRDAATRTLELSSIARQLWEDDFLNPTTKSELRCVLSALSYVHGAFADAADQRLTAPVEAAQR